MQGENPNTKTAPLEIVVMSSPLTDETVAELALAMTNAALGYEYAMLALEREGQYGIQTENIHAQLDSYKSSYFTKRERLSQLDGDKLAEIEERLCAQRQQFFYHSNTRH